MPQASTQTPRSEPTGPAADGFLLGGLDQLNSSRRQRLAALLEPRGEGELAARWHRYLISPRALLHESKVAGGSDPAGMRAVLIVPRQGLGALTSYAGPQDRNADVTVLGVSALRMTTTTTTTDDSGQPRLFMFDAARLPAATLSPASSPRQLMGMPRLLPGWAPVPATGACTRWRALQADPGSSGTTLAQHLLQCGRAELHALAARTEADPHWRFAMPRAELEDLCGDLLDIEAQATERCVARFCAHLNPIIVQGCKARRSALIPAEYNWVAAGHTARAWQWRMDALELFPALCTSAAPQALPVTVTSAMAKRSEALRRLKDWAETAPPRGATTIAQTVDGGLPLIRHLAATFKVKPVTIRALRHVSATMAPALERPPSGWPHLLRTLDRLPPERQPRTESQWEAFSTLYLEGHKVLQSLPSLPTSFSHRWDEQVMQPWLARAARDWVAHVERHRDAFRGVDGLDSVSELLHAVQAWFRQTRLRAGQRNRLLSRLAILRVEEWQALLNRWKASEDGSHQASRAKTPGRARPALTGVPGIASLPLPVRSLDSADLLRGEGRTMKHCVFTYWQQLPFRPYLIFAIGHDNDANRSTALLTYDRASRGGWTVAIKEQRGRRNATVSEASQRAALALCRLLSTPKARRYVDDVDMARAARQDALSGRSGAQWRQDGPLRQPPVELDRVQRLLEECGLWTPGEVPA